MGATRKGVLAPDDVASLLQTWTSLCEDIMGLPRPALRQLMEAELAGRRRAVVLMRIYGRYNRLRALDEKADLLAGRTLWHETN